MTTPPKVSFADALRAAAYLVENPDKWDEFKVRFGDAVCRAGLELAAKHLPAEAVRDLRTRLGYDGVD